MDGLGRAGGFNMIEPLQRSGVEVLGEVPWGILNTIPDCAWLKDNEGHFLAVNAAWCRFFGMDAREVLGKTAFEFLPAEVAEELWKQDRDIIESRQPLRLEESLRDKDGQLFWFETIKNPLFNKDGDVVGVSGIARDITDRRRAEEADRRLAAIVNSSDDAIISKALDGTILSWNQGAERIYGYSAQEAEGQSISILSPPEQADEVPVILAQIKRGEHIAHYETVRIRKDGSRIQVSLIVSPLKDAQGSIVGASTIARNITDRNDAEEQRQIAIEFLRLVNGSVGTRDLIQGATRFFQEYSGCEAVGIRLREGDDYPYYETRGFPQKFVLLENSLCLRGANSEPRRDGNGNPVLECMCGNVICGRFNPSKPFFTSAGSFWSNCTTELLASTTESDRQARTRNRCNGEGYESVALIPLSSGNQRFGLLQLNDRRKGQFTAERIALWERLAGYLAVAVAKLLAQQQLQESEKRYRSLFNGMTEGFALHEIICDEQGEPCDYRFLDANPAFEKLTGLSRDDTIGRTLREVLPAEEAAWIKTYGAVALTGQSVRFESHSAGLDRYFDVLAYRPAAGQFAIIFADITDRKRVEQEKLEVERRLLHAQKLESIGILAGGIAHDFNNILAGIMGYTDLVKRSLPTSEPVQADLEVIKKSVQRAAELTRQMLAYSGKGKVVVEPVSISQIVEDSKKMLEVSVSKKATLTYDMAPDLPVIQADASQIYQVVMNLVINASEALGEQGGTIAVSSRAIRWQAKDRAGMMLGEDLPEATCVCLEVADTGRGMDQQTLARIFEPFFTTKFTGRGLGLAAVHGIVRGHNGAIQVLSELGKGTTFRVLFPANGSAAPASRTDATATAWRGRGTVLVVDDEEIVRKLATRMIEQIGFSVLTANDGEAAIGLYREHRDAIACVLLDLTMPKMDGAETFRELHRISPDVRVILTSGFSEEGATERFSDLGLAGFIQKPYQFDTLLETIRAAVGGLAPERKL
jgi:PAS domain S-box-containing protein